jgi:hypothetical protein
VVELGSVATASRTSRARWYMIFGWSIPGTQYQLVRSIAIALAPWRAGGLLTFFILEEEVHRLRELGEEAKQIPTHRQHDETAV